MNEQIKLYFISVAYVLGGLIVGFLLEKVVLNRLKKSAIKTKWQGDDILIGSLKGIIIFLGLITGIYFGIHYLPDNESIKPIVGKIIFASFAFSLTIVAARIIVGMIKINTSIATGALPSTSIISNITRIIIYLIGSMVILQTMGISVTPVLTALGVGGLAVALALQDTLSNLFSGIQVIASQQIKTGDYVKLDSGEEGYIVDITWRSTTIRAIPNNIIIVPNSKLASAIVVNYQLPDKEIAVVIGVGVSYDSDLSKVEQVTIETAKEVLQTIEGGVKNFTPVVRYYSFADSSINFNVILRANEFANQYLLKHEFVKALHKKFMEHNIEIPFPIRTVHLKQNG